MAAQSPPYAPVQQPAEQYVGKDTLDDRELAHGAIDGLADAVGDTGHTTFMTPEERESRNDSLSGSYVEPYQSPLGQVVLVALLAAYVATLVWMKRMAIGQAMPRFLSPVTASSRQGGVG